MCCKQARWRWGYNFSYFALGYDLDTQPRPVLRMQAVLLDKMHKIYPDNPVRVELGGWLARRDLQSAVAVHATCYEGSMKLQGLKASNAFYNPHYYNPLRRTLTKPLMMISKQSLREELRTLAHLSVLTNRSLLVPNLLLGSLSFILYYSTYFHCHHGLLRLKKF